MTVPRGGALLVAERAQRFKVKRVDYVLGGCIQHIMFDQARPQPAQWSAPSEQGGALDSLHCQQRAKAQHGGAAVEQLGGGGEGPESLSVLDTLQNQHYAPGRALNERQRACACMRACARACGGRVETGQQMSGDSSGGVVWRASRQQPRVEGL